MTASPQGNGLRIAVDASGNRNVEIRHATSALGFLAIAALREPDGGLPDGTEAAQAIPAIWGEAGSHRVRSNDGAIARGFAPLFCASST